MFKQIYRFLSIFLISNFLFTQASFSKTPKNVKEPASSSNTCLEELEKLSKQAADKKPETVKQKPEKPYVTKYGVFLPDDVLDTYPQPQPQNDKKPVVKPKPAVKPSNDDIYVTKYAVYFPDDIFDTYPLQQQQNNSQSTDNSK
jgi:hypothetical protein